MWPRNLEKKAILNLFCLADLLDHISRTLKKGPKTIGNHSDEEKIPVRQKTDVFQKTTLLHFTELRTKRNVTA